MSVYTIINERVIAALENGVVPWRKPWNADIGMPKNIVSKKAYRGINTMLLGMTDYQSPWWMTYNQAISLGGHVKKGSSGTPVVFYTQAERKNNMGDTTTYPLLRYYTVFNLMQVDLEPIKVPDYLHIPIIEFTPLEVCERIVEGYKDKPPIKHGYSKAAYTPALDQIVLPNKDAFFQPEGYYGTLFHELVHSTGHESRLDRGIMNDFGDDNYAQEELVAEMGAAALCMKCNIENQAEHSTSYIRGWLKQLNDDPKMIVAASSQAQKAVDYILGELP